MDIGMSDSPFDFITVVLGICLLGVICYGLSEIWKQK